MGLLVYFYLAIAFAAALLVLTVVIAFQLPLQFKKINSRLFVMLLELLVAQIALGFMIDFATKGNHALTFIPTFTVIAIWLFRRKTKRSYYILWAIITLFIVGVVTGGAFRFGTVYTKMPLQRSETLNQWSEESGRFENTLWESVLVRNAPKYGERLRDAMIKYFDKETKDEVPGFYRFRVMSFYINNSSTRVFIKNVQDPYNFARVYLGDECQYDLGSICIREFSGIRSKVITYRTGTGDYDIPIMKTDTLSKIELPIE